MLITDNTNREDLIIIDRQVMDRAFKTKMDLLILKKDQQGSYRFCVIELKLGNNPELKDKVGDQLKGYMARIDSNFEDYKACYEKNFRQKRELGLLSAPDLVQIAPGCSGAVIVMGYSGMARQAIKELRQKHPSIIVIQKNYNLDTEKLA
jgi:hypothetical protein